MQLFSIDERAAIEDAISHAEKKTSGEIVVAQSTRSHGGGAWRVADADRLLARGLVHGELCLGHHPGA